MRKLTALVVPMVLCGLAAPARAELPQRITFPSEDGLEITADLYMVHPSKATAFIVLFHQAGWSRGEYREIAPKLNAMGYNCMAVDQRSGGGVNDIANQTAKRAAEAHKGTTYLDAIPDMRSALAYARKHYASGAVIAWGSSYSAALVLKLAGDSPGLVDGALAFSPGEYFAKRGKSKHWVRDSAAAIEKPVFITSARKERRQWSAIFDAIPAAAKACYVPKTSGNHGSRALWEKYDDSSGYWRAVRAFLAANFPVKRP